MMMKRWWKEFLIWWWKGRALRAIREYQRAVERLDCGAFLADHVSYRANKAWARAQRAMRRLRELDPKAPRATSEPTEPKGE